MILTPQRRLAREPLACAALTAAAAGLLLAFGPAPGDAAVHLYRTFLVRHGALVWDNYWLEGHYPLATYSLLYYLPAALVGNLALVLASAVCATLLFAAIARREWGEAALWPSRVFAVCAAAPLFTGLYSYSLGFTAMLGTVRALQARKTAVAVPLAAVTLGFSPLAFAFLCLLLGSALAVRRRVSVPAIAIAATIAALAGFELVVMRLFPGGGVYPFHLASLAAVVGVSTVGALLARHAQGGAALRAFFLLWGGGSVLGSLVATPIGDNWVRLDEFVFPVMLLTASLARFQPRRLTLLALTGALAFNMVPYLMLIPYRLDPRPAKAAFWQPPLRFLHRHAETGFRVEVVPTAAHWESYWIPRGGFPLARGFYRQLDSVDNPVLYRQHLSAAAYRHWLRQAAVEYVLLPATRLDAVGASAEAGLLRSGHSGLVVAFRGPNWTIYRLPRATPLVTGPAPARVLAYGHTTIAVFFSARGRYLLREHYVPFWHVTGAACVRRAPGRLTYLDVSASGTVTLRVLEAGAAVLRAADSGGTCGAHAAERSRD